MRFRTLQVQTLHVLNLCLGICQGHLIADTLSRYISIQMESPRTSP